MTGKGGRWFPRGLPLRRIHALAGLALLAQSDALAQVPGEAVSLFTTEPRAPAGVDRAVAGAVDATAGGRRTARVDRLGLRALREDVAAGRPGKLRLNLFADVEYEASLERTAATASGYTLSGPLKGIPFGSVVLVVNDGVTLGRLHTPAGDYSIRGTESFQSVERMPAIPLRCGLEAGLALRDGAATTLDGPRALRSGPARRVGKARHNGFLRRSVADPPAGVTNPGAVPRKWPRPTGTAGTAAEEDRDVDLLVVYPPFARAAEGGYGPMHSLIDLDVATTNEALAASGVGFRIGLAAAIEVEGDLLEGTLALLDAGVDGGDRYAPDLFSYWVQAMHGLGAPDDGYLDEVHALRERHAADLMLLHLGRPQDIPGPVLGLGRLPYAMTREAVREAAFAMSFSYGLVVAHELGHAMGLLHDRHNDRENFPFPYSHGFRYWLGPTGPSADSGSQVAGTIMAVGVPFRPPLVFSNPDLVHPEDPNFRLGVSGDEPSSAVDGPADAARHLNEVGSLFANARARADACRYTLEGDRTRLPAAGGSYRVRMRTQPGCAWTARGGAWVSSVWPPEGSGTGEIRYTVPENPHSERSVELVVAGRLHVRSQVGGGSHSRKMTPVCERSGRVAATLIEAHPDWGGWRLDNQLGLVSIPPCNEMRFDPEILGSIRNMSLDVASGISKGRVRSALRPGDFHGLTGLRRLRLENVEHLPESVFEGLTNLQRLHIRERDDGLLGIGRALRKIDPDAFLGLPQLGQLLIENHRLKRLEAGTFRDLGRLRYLRVVASSAVRTLLEPGLLDGLDELAVLTLKGVSIRESPLDRFHGLARLRGLVLPDSGVEAFSLGTLRAASDLIALDLSHNALQPLESDTFEGLSRLWLLKLDATGIRGIPPGLFEPLGSLELLSLTDNELGALRSDVFDKLTELHHLYLQRSGITSLAAGVFDNNRHLRVLHLADNQIRELERGALRGTNASRFSLHGNPGAPFTLAVAPVPVPDQHRKGSVQPGFQDIVLEIPPASPYWLRASVAGSGVSLWTWYWGGELRDLTIYPGDVHSFQQITAGADGDGPATVWVEEPRLGNDDGWLRSSLFRIEDPGKRPFTTGIRVAAGPPLVLFDIADRSFVQGRGGETIDLRAAFPDWPEYEAAASSSDEAVAAVSIEDGRWLTVTPGAGGMAEITVTAYDRQYQPLPPRRFRVTVRVPSIPLLPSASRRDRGGLVRVLNHSGKAGTVRITAIDDAGTRHGPVRLRLRPYGAAQFDDTDLEEGNETRRLLDGIGAGLGDGDWRLEFRSDIDIEALSYVRTGDGALATVHDAAPVEDGLHRIATFHPASDMLQSSRLRVINPGGKAAEVTVRGVDDAGAAPGSPVRFTIPAGAAREFDAWQLEAGDPALDGALGDGAGKWRLAVESESPVMAMSLLSNKATGQLTNLSSTPPPTEGGGVHQVALFPAAGHAMGLQGLARVVNRSEEAAVVRIDAFDDAGARHGPLELAVAAGAVAHFGSDDLELGAPGKGLTGATGAGDGDWRLELSSDQEIEVLAYANTADGVATTLHDTVAVRDGRRQVALFHPAGDSDGTSVLRLANPLERDLRVAIHGTDDHGKLPGVAVYVDVPARAAVTLTAEELEAGLPDPYPDGEGKPRALGRGWGNWRLSVVAEPEVLVQSLLEGPAGGLTNLSSAPRAGAH